MPATVRRFSMRPRPGACLALLAAACFAPVAARAGCVHDSLRRTLEPSGSAHFRWLIAAGAMTASAGEPRPAPLPVEREIPGPPKPCSGPSCSGRDGPPAIPQVVVEPASGSWAWSGVSPDPDGTGSVELAAADLRPRPIHSGISVFHPPRCIFA